MALCCKLTVEPVLFLFMLASFMQYTVFQEMVYETVCLSSFNTSICDALDDEDNRPSLVQVQRQASDWLMWSSISFVFPSIIATNFLGSWGDSYGRKLPLVLPSFGSVLGILVFVSSWVFGTPSLIWILIGSALSGLSGGFVSCIMAVTSYISEVSNRQTRTSRVSLLEISLSLAAAIGPTSAATLANAVNMEAVFAVCLTLHVIVILYVNNIMSGLSGLLRNPVDATCREFLGANHLVGAVRSCFRYREDNRRTSLIYLLICSLIVMTVAEGEISQTFVYVHEDPPGWDITKFGEYFALRNCLSCIPLLLVGWLHLMHSLYQSNRCFKLPSDAALLIVGLISKMAGLAFLGLAHSDLHLFLVPLLSMCGYLCMPALRSLISKQVDPGELGKVFAFLAMLQNLSTLFGSLAFNGLYPITRSILPGLVFEIGAYILVIPLIIIAFGPQWDAVQIDYANIQEPNTEEAERHMEEEDVSLSTDDSCIIHEDVIWK